MKQSFILYLLIIISVFCLNLVSFAQQSDPQTTNNETKQGLIVGKAIYLGKPIYPKEARQNRIAGTVSVKITINENGKVIKAEAQTGDVSLRKAAEEAALQSKFTPTTLNGTPIQVTARISFNFTLSDDWEAIGAALSSIESGVAGKSYGQHSFDFNWLGFEEERTEFEDLRKDETTGGKANRAAILIKTIEEKLKIWNPTEYWLFKLGGVISKLINSAEKTGEAANFQKYLKDLKQIVKVAPADIPKERMEVLNEVVKYAAMDNLTTSDRSKIAKLLIESYNRKIQTK